MSIFKRKNKNNPRKTFTEETKMGVKENLRYYLGLTEGDTKVKKEKRSGKKKEFYEEDGKTYKKKTTRKGKVKVKEISSKRFAKKLKRYGKKLKGKEGTYHDTPGEWVDPVSGGTRKKTRVRTTGSKKSYGQEYMYAGDEKGGTHGHRTAIPPGSQDENAPRGTGGGKLPLEKTPWVRKGDKTSIYQIHEGYQGKPGGHYKR